MKKIHVGIIGCGRIVGKHISALVEISDVIIDSLCDIETERAEKLAQKYNCSVFKEYKDLINKKIIDVVIICTPSYLHAEMTIAAANAKKHVIVEKPMAMTVTDAERMIAACEKNNVKLFVVKQNRYNIPVLQLRSAIEENRFGKIFLANMSLRWSRDQNYYDQDHWKGTKDMDGGVFMNQAIHFVDLLQWMIGDVESVFAKTDTMTHNIEADDTGVAVLKFKNGALATLDATTSICEKNIEASITIFGEHGSVKVGGFAVNNMEIWYFQNMNPSDEKIKKTSTNPPNIYGFGHKEFIKDAIDTIINNKKPFIDGYEGIKSLKIVESIYRSTRSKKEIIL